MKPSIEAVTPVGPNARALQKLLSARRALSSTLLNADAYERWGARTDEDRAAIAREISEAQTEYERVSRELTELVASLRKTDPTALEEWVAAHERLLHNMLEALGQDPTRNSGTERFVAQGELREWNEVREGKRAFCDENVYYVHQNPELFRALFGEPKR